LARAADRRELLDVGQERVEVLEEHGARDLELPLGRHLPNDEADRIRLDRRRHFLRTARARRRGRRAARGTRARSPSFASRRRRSATIGSSISSSRSSSPRSARPGSVIFSTGAGSGAGSGAGAAGVGAAQALRAPRRRRVSQPVRPRARRRRPSARRIDPAAELRLPRRAVLWRVIVSAATSAPVPSSATSPPSSSSGPASGALLLGLEAGEERAPAAANDGGAFGAAPSLAGEPLVGGNARVDRAGGAGLEIVDHWLRYLRTGLLGGAGV
jgi:hypothetical protein